MSMLLSRSS